MTRTSCRANRGLEDGDSLEIKMVKMLSHFGFEKLNSEPEIARYPPDLDLGIILSLLIVNFTVLDCPRNRIYLNQSRINLVSLSNWIPFFLLPTSYGASLAGT